MMAKRFTDTEKWRDPWFYSLPTNYKLFWLYILDVCDNSGIYKVNFKLANIELGFKIDIKKVMDLFKNRIQFIDSEKILILKFAEFQYGSFRNSKHPFHKKLVSIIDNSKKDTVSIVYQEGIDTLQEEEEDKDKEQEEEKEEEKRVKREEEYSEEFISFWNSTNRKGSKKEAFQKFNNRLKTHSIEDIQKAYAQLKTEKSGQEIKYWPDVSGFLNTYFDGYFERALNPIEFTPKIKTESALEKRMSLIPFGGGITK